MNTRLKKIIKWVWIIFVFIFVAYYIITRKTLIFSTLNELGLTIIISATTLILIAKVLLVQNMRFAAQRADLFISFWEGFYIYNMTQLPKYIPGSIWQFLTRFAVLKEKGATNAQIRDSILSEQIWVLLIALLLGVILTLIFAPYVFLDSLSALLNRQSGLYIYSFVFFAIVTILYIYRKKIFPWITDFSPSPLAFANLLMVWGFLGTSFWLTLMDFSNDTVNIFYCIGFYSLAFFIGFLSPFAPAGIGIREAILVASTSHIVGIDIAILLAGINRILYVFVELLLIIPCIIWKVKFSKS